METSEYPTELSSFINYTVDNLNDNKYESKLNILYTVCEVLVAVCAVLGNGLVIIVFGRERKLRRRTNYYIISLATADLLVGLFAIPFAILASIGLPTNLYACLFTVSVLIVLCTISIFCLVAVSIDRYWAILYPMGYSRTVRTKTAIGIICICWVAGSLVGFLPLLGWNAGKKADEKCIFTEVMDYDYLVFLYFATIIFPAFLIAAFYAHIYRVVVKQLQQIVTMNPAGTGTMLRCLGAAQKREVKATQNLSRIVIFFILCWFPLYTINCVMAFCPQCQVNEIFLNFCIILSHLNSVGNPLLYAYHLKDFRAALKNFIYRLLFPQGNLKASVVNVVQERRNCQRQLVCHHSSTGFVVSRKQHLTHLKQVSDFNSKSQATNLKIGSSLKPEEHSESQASTPSYDEQLRKDQDFVSEYGSPNISIKISEMRQNDQSSSTNNISSESELESPASRRSAIELRTYKSFLRIVDSDKESFDENIPDSILVIEVDVNRIASSHERLTVQDSNIVQDFGE